VTKTLNLLEAAAFLHMHPEEVRTRAKSSLIPGAKPGNRWVFWKMISRSLCDRSIRRRGKRHRCTQRVIYVAKQTRTNLVD
jgi:hypothetical protein